MKAELEVGSAFGKDCPKCNHSWDLHDIAYFGPGASGFYCSSCDDTCKFISPPPLPRWDFDRFIYALNVMACVVSVLACVASILVVNVVQAFAFAALTGYSYQEAKRAKAEAKG